MKKLIFVTMLLISMLPLLANLAFDEPVPLYDFDNYELDGQSVLCPNGNLVVFYKQSKQGVRNTFMQIYSPEYQTLLIEPVMFASEISGILVHPNNSIALLQYSYNAGAFILSTYDQTGNLIPNLSNITISRTFREMISDGLGGLHIIGAGHYTYYYQHIDAMGNLAHPVQGLSIEGEGDYVSKMIATEDHGALLSIPIRVGYSKSIKFVKISPLHQITNEFTIPAIDQYAPQLSLLSADSNSFFVVWGMYTGFSYSMSAARVSYAGQCQWVVECASDSSAANIAFLDATLINSEGNLIVNYTTRVDSPQSHTSYFDVIDPLGNLIYSQLTNPLQPSSCGRYSRYLVADNAGGWYLVSHYSGQNPDHLVQHFTQDYTPWPNTVDIASPTANTLSLYFYENDLRLLYEVKQDNQTSFYAQIIDIQANIAFPEPGLCLQEGVTDNAFGMQSCALPNGACLSMWHQGRQNASNQKLMYNIISPIGNSLFPIAQCFVEVPTVLVAFHCYPMGNTGVMVVWVTCSNYVYTSRAQVLDTSGDILWGPEGRLLYSGSGYPIFSMHNDVLYMAHYSSGIRLHRYINGIPAWPEEGILAGIQNSGWPDTYMHMEALAGNRIFWSQDHIQESTDMSFMNIVDDEGNLQYPVEGLPLADFAGSEYGGIKPRHYFWQGDTLIYVMYYYFLSLEYEGGHGGSYYWQWNAHLKLQTINPDGSLGQAPSEGQYFSSNVKCLSEGALYGFACYSSPFSIWKYDLSGNPLWSVPFNHNSILRELCPLPDGRILLVSDRHDTSTDSYWCHYFFLNPNGSIEIPDDTAWAMGSSSNQYSFCSTDYGVYMVLTPNGNYSGVQYYEVTTLANDDPHLAPAVQLLSQNFPNPFKEQTRVCLKLDEAAPASLKVYNIRGQMVKTLCSEDLPKGDSYLDWDGKDDKGNPCTSGVYIFRAKANKKSKTIKVLKIQ